MDNLCEEERNELFGEYNKSKNKPEARLTLFFEGKSKEECHIIYDFLLLHYDSLHLMQLRQYIESL